MKQRLVSSLTLLLCASFGLAADFVVEPPLPSFEDVEMEHWAYDAVDNLREKGLLEGWGERFHGRRTFTRFEMAEILARYTEKLEEARDQLTSREQSQTRKTLQEKVQELRRRRTGETPSGFSRMIQGNGVEELEQQVERIAAMVATHQVLLEEPEIQSTWRTRMGVKSTRSGSHGPGLFSPPLETEQKADPQATKLLEELDQLSRGVKDLPPLSKVEAPSSRERLQMALSRMGGDPNPLRTEARENRQREFSRRMGLSRSLRLASLPSPTPVAQQHSGQSTQDLERRQDQRLLQVLEEVRQGKLDPERARAIAHLASLAVKAPVVAPF